ncbi:MAG TPA: transcription antitermination factor NusB [Stellaceae bacterium]|nr:transcription antitermination factor NusB [Stellaceae bacterium]
MSADEPRARPGTIKRSLARLAAVQALYQIDLNDAPAETVIAELRDHGADEEGFGEADNSLLGDIVRGVVANRDDLDGMLNEALAPDWTLLRLEAVLRAVLRGGAYELLARLEIPARVVLNEYVDIAHAFFSGKEPKLVNGVLDRIGHRLRPDELHDEAAAS